MDIVEKFLEIAKEVNAELGEAMMGFPIGWTELSASEMPSSRKSRKSSANSSQNTKV